MTDIVERLRKVAEGTYGGYTHDVAAQAADEIERLREEVSVRLAQVETHLQANVRLEARLAEAELNLAEVPTLCRRYEARLAEVERWKQYVIDYAPDVADEADAFLAPDSASVAMDRPWQEIVKDATRYMWLRREHERERNLFPLAAVVWKGAGRESATWVNLVDADALDRKIDEQIASDQPSGGVE